jgi:heat-inducible transcriptional repressor
VGSRTIEKKYNLGISSATIRNEMADLEEMGYLIQPHTSSGRIPSDKAYRMYVDQFMKVVDLDTQITDQIRKQFGKYFGEFESCIRQTSEILSKLTNYTALVMTPSISSLNIKDVRIVPIEKERALLMILTKEGLVKNTELKLNASISRGQTDKINNFLRLCINDTQSERVVSSFAEKIDALDFSEQQILSQIIPAIKRTLRQGNADKVYASGVTEIINYPEFQNMDKAKQILDALHKQDLLAHLLQLAMDDNYGIKIGNENEEEELNECSVLTATYKLNGQSIGTIGIVGPTRMNYDYCVSALNALSKELSAYISNTIGGEDA